MTDPDGSFTDGTAHGTSPADSSPQVHWTTAAEIGSSGVALPVRAGSVDRRRYLPERARGKRVLHLGCVDEGLLEARSASGGLLHADLAAVAAELTGVDLSAPGLEALAMKIPGRYVCGDVQRLSELDLPGHCDLVIAGEIIEHLPSPGRFLAELRRYLIRTGATAILTTPNSYSWLGFLRLALNRREPTHPDHLHVYSPVTLARTVQAADLQILAMRTHNWSSSAKGRHRARALIDAGVLRWNPWLAVGLVVEVAPGS